MWPAERLLDLLSEGPLARLLTSAEREALVPFGQDELLAGARQALERPMPRDPSPAARAIAGPLLNAQWLALLQDLAFPRDGLMVEVCAGGSPPVLLALAAHTEGRGRYVGVNLNRALGAQLRERAASLRMDMTFVEDNALHLSRHVSPASADGVAFHHAVNDILQTAVADMEGIDTVPLDWWPNERDLIERMGGYDEAGRLESVGWETLRAILEAAVEAVRPGGVLPFDHWTWHGHLEQEWFPGDLFNDMIPRTRLLGTGLPLREITPGCLDRRWWLVWERVG